MFRLKKIRIEGFKSDNIVKEFEFADGNITVMYGENGCGKTSVLNIIHGVFAGNSRLLWENNVNKLEMEYTIKGLLHKCTVERDHDEIGKISYNWTDTEKIKDIKTAYLGIERVSSRINITPGDIMRYISDDRVLSDILSDKTPSDKRKISSRLASQLLGQSFGNNSNENIFTAQNLLLKGDIVSIETIEKKILYSYNKIIEAANLIVQNSLLNIIGRLARNANEFIKDKQENISFVNNNLDTYLKIIQLVLTSTENTKNILIEIKDKNSSEIINICKNNPIIAMVLKEIILSMKEQFNYLSSVYILQDIFNSFVSKKEIVIDKERAKILMKESGDSHSLHYLSSGEKHLLTQLVCLILDSNNRSLFLIDEPEISFNILWQEKYIDILEKVAPNTQFVIATHSPAIPSGHYNYLKELI